MAELTLGILVARVEDGDERDRKEAQPPCQARLVG